MIETKEPAHTREQNEREIHSLLEKLKKNLEVKTQENEKRVVNVKMRF